MKSKEISLSPEFKAQTTKAILAIVLFIATYLLLLTLAVALTVGCIAAGLGLIVLKPMVFTILIGIGLASLGVLILIFLLKFIFKKHKIDRSHLLEINEKDQPVLFEMIREIVTEVGTTFPKKVYLSSEINASVFYDSSFWSMILPVRKNLQIGLGLLNTITREELRSILSHEFGHFSQRTMKVGSYVYNVNQVIFNLLYDNETYENLIQRWASANGSFSFFVAIAVKINEGIQWLLRKMYEIVNTSYMALSREMEFHADEIAARVTGHEPLKSALSRLTLADTSFNNVIEFYHTKISDNYISDNIFKEQDAVSNFLAEVNSIGFKNGFPDISLEEMSKFDKSKLVVKNQWSSHPSTEERVKRLEASGYSTQILSDAPANSIFKNIEQLQKHFTETIFKTAKYQGQPVILSFQDFEREYKQQALANTFDKLYNGYYDNKNPSVIDTTAPAPQPPLTFSELFSDERVDWVYTALALQNDMESLKKIADKSLVVKTFDYDGMRFKRKDAGALAEKLKHELDTLKTKINQNDLQIFHYFHSIEIQQGGSPRLANMYQEYFAYDTWSDKGYELYNQLVKSLHFVSVRTPNEEIVRNLAAILPLEREIRQSIQELLRSQHYSKDLTRDMRNNLEEFVSKDHSYFDGANYNNENLAMLDKALSNFTFLLSRKFFMLKKEILDYQIELHSSANTGDHAPIQTND